MEKATSKENADTSLKELEQIKTLQEMASGHTPASRTRITQTIVFP